MIHPSLIGRDVTRDEVVKYGYKSGQCGSCNEGLIRRAVGRRATRGPDGKIVEDYEWQVQLCPVAHDRFLRRMEKRLAILETGRVHWVLGLEPESFWFTMMYAAEMLNYQDRILFDQHIDKSVWPWILRSPDKLKTSR